MSNNAEDDAPSRIRDRVQDRVTDAKKKVLPARPSCLSASVSLGFALMIAIGTLFLSCVPSCRRGVFGTAEGEDVSQLESIPEGAVPFGAIPTSQHVRDTNGTLVRSFASGNGWKIEWRSPSAPQGAVSEQLLDNVLSHWQAMSQSGLGSDELSRHIFALDKLVNDLRNGEVTRLEQTMGQMPAKVNVAVPPGSFQQPTGAGFGTPQPAPKLEGDSQPVDKSGVGASILSDPPSLPDQ